MKSEETKSALQRRALDTLKFLNCIYAALVFSAELFFLTRLVTKVS